MKRGIHISFDEPPSLSRASCCTQHNTNFDSLLGLSIVIFGILSKKVSFPNVSLVWQSIVFAFYFRIYFIGEG